MHTMMGRCAKSLLLQFSFFFGESGLQVLRVLWETKAQPKSKCPAQLQTLMFGMLKTLAKDSVHIVERLLW